MEQLNDNLLFRWFVGLEIDDAVWNHAVFQQEPRPTVEPGPGAEVLRLVHRFRSGLCVTDDECGSRIDEPLPIPFEKLVC